MNSDRTRAVEELVIPTDLTSPGADAFEEMVEVRNRVETGILGSGVLSHSAAELLPGFQNPYKPRRLFVARSEGRIVARAILSWRAAANSSVATVNVEVQADHRGQGIGSALLNRMEEIARQSLSTIIHSYVTHSSVAGGARVSPPTGYGSLPASDPGVQFLSRRGYELEQIKRLSFLNLPVPASALRRFISEAYEQAGSNYTVMHWVGPTPPEWLADLARLKTRMSTEDPTGGMGPVEDPWDEERLRRRDKDQQSSGRLLLTAAVSDQKSRELVGFTELSLAAKRDGAAAQEETLVLPEHRGHRLGMLLKASNLQQVGSDAPLIYTFNAEENRPMLAVNEALGFSAAGYEGAWKKQL